MINIVVMVFLAGVSRSDCDTSPLHSRGVAIVGVASNEIECWRRAMFDPAKSAPFRDLAPGEFLKTACVHKGA